MKPWRLLSLSILSLALACGALHAQPQRLDPDRPDKKQYFNQAPPPGVFTVLSTNPDAQTVTMRAQNGAVVAVYVGSDIYDISTLNKGDRIQVDFLVPDAMNSRIAAASLWPVK